MPEQRGAFAYPRQLRLLRATEFERVFKRAIRSSDAWFMVLAIANQRSHGRLGLAIAKKHTRTGVARNRIKRLVRESFRLHQNTLMGLDLVVVCRGATAKQTNGVLYDSLRKHWEKLVQRCASSSSS